ncbi:MAG TPA: histidine kinase [Chitinophagaceae bacterium]|nr:histidine kinase [Chitinophagaceae bacterium]
MKKFIYILVSLLIVTTFNVFAQYPQYIAYDSENALPSNEVYSIVQDNNGFIWIGCNVGLYKFNGVHYTSYKSKTQNSKPITGLTISSSGNIYCYNFQSQLFCLENDTLKEIKHPFPKGFINNLVSDNNGNIYATHFGGISRYSEKSKQWNNYINYGNIEKNNNEQLTAKSVKGNGRDVIPFIYSKGVATIENNKLKQIYNTELFESITSGKFELETYSDVLWIFAKETENIYRFSKNHLEQIKNSQLNKILSGRKITNVRTMRDSALWICTYSGLIRYTPNTDSAILLYPDLSFSDCLIDQEGNYWFTTLLEGILRVPNLHFIVWKQYNKLTRVTNSETHIFFASQKGEIGRLNLLNETTELFHTKHNADIQSFDYNTSENALLFNINNHLFKLKGNAISEINNDNIPAIKSAKSVNGSLFATSTYGTYINGKRINTNWARQIEYDVINQCLWVASNSGLLKIISKNNEWYLSDTLLSNTQIISIDFDVDKKLLYVLTFTGQIFVVNSQNETSEFLQIPENIQANKLQIYQDKLYISSNVGVAIFDPKTHSLKFINRLLGLVSDNVQDITIVDSNLWLVTVNGLQKIPLNKLEQQQKLARVYLKNNFKFPIDQLQFNYNEAFVLHPEVAHYSSNGQFVYAYRLNKNEWIKLPATIEQIEIQNIPIGNFEIELKAIDYLGRDSENIIKLEGYINPPFWKTWWFTLLLILLSTILIFFIVQKNITNFRRKEKQKTQLAHLQLTALKAQMNPHFMYNTLNSIQALILKQDIKNSNLYLSKFSHLMRKVLDVSGRDEISIQEEIEILELYLSLEKLRFGNDFLYKIIISNEVETQAIFLPPLLLQPFVENAIKHGLLHKKGEKQLIIRLEKETNHILCRIKDNGIGRKHSAEIKKRQQEKYTSFSTDATQKRLTLINSTYHKNIELEINDLYENNNPSGTEVVLRIFGALNLT